MIVESVGGVKIGGDARDIQKIMDHSPEYEVIAIQEKDEVISFEMVSQYILFVLLKCLLKFKFWDSKLFRSTRRT